jgi:hypothetical protein
MIVSIVDTLPLFRLAKLPERGRGKCGIMGVVWTIIPAGHFIIGTPKSLASQK